MDVSGSKWSSGCESGWTFYLDESHVFQGDDNNCNNVSVHQSYRVNSVSYDQEDLSMVSDASSGPPQLQDDYNEEGECYGLSTNYREKSLKKEKRSSKNARKEKKELSKQYQHHHSNLDDTASSPAISYAKMYDNPSTNQSSFMGFSQNLSETHFQGNPAVSNHYGFWQSSHPDTANSAEPSKLRGRRWG